jgi:hypothetical protein
VATEASLEDIPQFVPLYAVPQFTDRVDVEGDAFRYGPEGELIINLHRTIMLLDYPYGLSSITLNSTVDPRGSRLLEARMYPNQPKSPNDYEWLDGQITFNARTLQRRSQDSPEHVDMASRAAQIDRGLRYALSNLVVRSEVHAGNFGRTMLAGFAGQFFLPICVEALATADARGLALAGILGGRAIRLCMDIMHGEDLDQLKMSACYGLPYDRILLSGMLALKPGNTLISAP